jgi:hypothetical protein
MDEIVVDKIKVKNDSRMRSSSDKKVNEQKNFRRH